MWLCWYGIYPHQENVKKLLLDKKGQDEREYNITVTYDERHEHIYDKKHS